MPPSSTCTVYSCFFFSRRRRHTRCSRDWSSDVCSSDLIGALVVSDGQETFHTFWADQESDEPAIFTQFAETICQLDNFRILHYGDYESVALRRIKARLPECHHSKIDMVLERATNVMSVVYPHIYFPTYSNGLKDIGHFLGCERTQK